MQYRVKPGGGGVIVGIYIRNKSMQSVVANSKVGFTLFKIQLRININGNICCERTVLKLTDWNIV
jgi:hypothetical protein